MESRTGKETEDQATILVVDDNKEIVYSISELLKYEGFEVVKAYDGMQALDAMEEHSVDLILLDVMMPRLNGLSALMKLREKSRIPVIILSAKTEESDKVSGLVLGADDYVSKPFSPKELMARVNAVLKRTGNSAGTMIRFGDFCILTAERLVKAGDKTISLPPKEFDLLVKLARNEHIVLKREQLLESVWGYEYYGDTRTVDTHIKSLREHLGEYRRLIQTVWGVGYKFEYKEC